MAQEEMSELRGNLRLLEKDRRCLESTLMVQNEQESAEALILDSLREELGERRAAQQVFISVLSLLSILMVHPWPDYICQCTRNQI